jgi:hypothetical protein
MKIVARFFLFISAFVVGTQAAALFSQVWPEMPEIAVNEKTDWLETERASSPDGIQVSYTGVIPAHGNEPASLRFIAHNGTSKTIVYGAKGAENPSPDVFVNGQLVVPQGWRCGSGARLYEIAPGASAEFHVGVYEFETIPSKGSLITVGYYLNERDSKLLNETFSEPFVLPDTFRRAIIDWKREEKIRWG